MINKNYVVAGAGLVVGTYLLYKFWKPLNSVIELTGNTAEILNKGVGATSNIFDFGTGALIDLSGGNSDNPIKKSIQTAGFNSGVATNTIYNDVGNSLKIGLQSFKNFFSGNDDKTNITRFELSSDNSKYIGSDKVANTFIVDNYNNYLGSYSNILNQSTSISKKNLTSLNYLNNSGVMLL